MQENEIIDEQVNTAPDENGGTEQDTKLYSQEELDRRVNEECEQLRKKLADAEKLAGMSEKERADHRRSVREKELAEREAAVAKRELIADAAERLAEAGLPKQLAACLNYSGREECEQSLEAVAQAFESAVTGAVNRRIKGNVPKFAGSGPKDAFLDGLGL